MRSRYPFLLLVVIFLIHPIGTAQAESRQEGLSFAVQSKIVEMAAVAKKGAAPTKNTKVAYRTVTLFPEVVSVKDKQSETIYDFKNRRLITIYPGSKTYSMTALYAVPAFNAMEKANRSMLGQTLGQAGIPEVAAPEPFDLDMLFGGTYKQEDTKGLESTKDPKGGAYKFRGEDIAGYRLTDSIVPDALKRSYARYLAYEYTLHPLIRKELQALGVFSSLRFTNYSLIPAVAEKSYTTSLVHAVTEVPPSIPVGYTFVLPGKESATKILMAPMLKATSQNSVALIKKLYADKKYTDVAMAFMGHTYAYGTENVEQLKPILSVLMKEAPPESRVREILGLCSVQPTAQGVEPRVAFLKQIQQVSPQYGYMIGGCLAIYQDAAGKAADAQATRLATLEKNPALVAVMKDLGDGYYRQYDPYTAWVFWNKARTINPRHPLATGLNGLEQKLVQDFPDYF